MCVFLSRRRFAPATANFCTPEEARFCYWRGQKCHPDDLKICDLTGLPIHFEYSSSIAHGYDTSSIRLQPLMDLLDGIRRTQERSEQWDAIAEKASIALDGSRCQVEAAQLSPDGRHLAACLKVSSLFGPESAARWRFVFTC